MVQPTKINFAFLKVSQTSPHRKEKNINQFKTSQKMKTITATNTGYQSAATNTYDQSEATNTGAQSAATNTGNQSAATNTGTQSAATNTGDQSVAINRGNRSAATNTGNQSVAINRGNRSVAINTGDRSTATVEGKESIAIAAGKSSKAKGKIDCWIVLSEWIQDKAYNWSLKQVKAFEVDGKIVKEDTFYSLINGQLKEIEE